MASTLSKPDSVARHRSVENGTRSLSTHAMPTTTATAVEEPLEPTLFGGEHVTESMEEGERPSRNNCGEDDTHERTDLTIALSSTSKMAGKTVAPFLARHIPDQYAPLGIQSPPSTISKHTHNTAGQDPNSKYCYRHRPDSKCRRTADEPTMENLQRVGLLPSI